MFCGGSIIALASPTNGPDATFPRAGRTTQKNGLCAVVAILMSMCIFACFGVGSKWPYGQKGCPSHGGNQPEADACHEPNAMK
jgi:hypothetical protein